MISSGTEVVFMTFFSECLGTSLVRMEVSGWTVTQTWETGMFCVTCLLTQQQWFEF